jgi:capsular exopolysaccharide synthesis family protein
MMSQNQTNQQNGNGTETISIQHILSLMLARIWWIIVLFLVGAGVAFGVTKCFMPLKYQSYISMYVKSKTSDSDGDANMNDLSASKSLVSTYIVVLQDDTVMNELSDQLLKEYGEERLSQVFSISDGQISAATLRGCLTMAAVDSTEVMKITAITTDAEISAAMCNAMAEIAPDFLIRVVGAGSVEKIGSATIHNAPVSPDVKKNTAMGAVIGAVLAIAIILLLDFMDNTVKDAASISKRYDSAIIGEIDNFSMGKTKQKKNQAKADQHKLLTDADVPFHIIESYKSMRTNIIFALAATEDKIFAISSPNAGEGKSTTASNIALALAQADHKVLLIDGDLRKPVQHKIFKVSKKKGFSNAICKQVSVDACIVKNVVGNLDFLPAGETPPNPSELLASAHTVEILHHLEEIYDFVLIDAPPINVVSDILGLSQVVAGTFLVLRYGKTTYDDVERAQNYITLANMHMLGFILNDVKVRRGIGGTYYRHGTSYYYNREGYGYQYGGKASEDEEEETLSVAETETETPESNKPESDDTSQVSESDKQAEVEQEA